MGNQSIASFQNLNFWIFGVAPRVGAKISPLCHAPVKPNVNRIMHALPLDCYSCNTNRSSHFFNE